MKKIKMLIIIAILIFVANTSTYIVSATAAQSNPHKPLPDGTGNAPPYSPGQQNQQNQEEQEEQETLKEMEKLKKLSDDEKKKFSAEKIIEYIDTLYRISTDTEGQLAGSIMDIDESWDVINEWSNTLEEAGYTGEQNTELGNEVYRAMERNLNSKKDLIFNQPSISDVSSSSTDSIDGLLSDSNSFLEKGKNDRINEKSIQDFSKTMYNILIVIATFTAVLIGGILGIKIMLSSAEEKAQVKELLIPYVIGCVVVFGAFGIWKLVVNILQNI